MLQEQHAGALPRLLGVPCDLRAVDGLREAHRAPVVVARLDFRCARIAPHRDGVPQRAGVGRPHPQHRREAHLRDVGQPPERALARHRSEAFAVQHQLGPTVRRQLHPSLVDRVDHHPAGIHRLLPVTEERNPAGQIGILRSDQRGVAVVHHLQRPRRDGVDPPGAGGRHDHQQLAIEGTRALEFAEQHGHSGLFGVGGLQADVDADGLLRGPSVDTGQFVGVRPGGDEVAALKAEGVPRRERVWAA